MMAMQAIRSSVWGSAGAVLVVLAGCDSGVQSHANAFPMSERPKFDQPMPSMPLLGSDKYMRAHDVLPSAKADTHEPLPPAVPLPARLAQQEVVQPTGNTMETVEKQGGSSPAAGMAAGVTSAQGGGEKNQLDGGVSK